MMTLHTANGKGHPLFDALKKELRRMRVYSSIIDFRVSTYTNKGQYIKIVAYSPKFGNLTIKPKSLSVHDLATAFRRDYEAMRDKGYRYAE